MLCGMEPNAPTCSIWPQKWPYQSCRSLLGFAPPAFPVSQHYVSSVISTFLPSWGCFSLSLVLIKAILKLVDNNLLWKNWLSKQGAHVRLEFWAMTRWRLRVPQKEVSSIERAVARQDLMSKKIRFRISAQWMRGKAKYTVQKKPSQFNCEAALKVKHITRSHTALT